MNYDKIQAALEVHTAAIPDLPFVVYENVRYSPTTNVPFIRARFVPISRTQKALGINEVTHKPFWMDYQGLYQLALNMPESEGSKRTNLLVNKLCDAFEATTVLTFDGVKVVVKKTESTRGINETPWFKTSVNVHWYSHSK